MLRTSQKLPQYYKIWGCVNHVKLNRKAVGFCISLFPNLDKGLGCGQRHTYHADEEKPDKKIPNYNCN